MQGNIRKASTENASPLTLMRPCSRSSPDHKPTSHYFSGLSLTLRVLLPSVAGARDFDRVALGPLGIPTFQVRADGSIASRHEHPGRFGSPGSRGDRR